MSLRTVTDHNSFYDTHGTEIIIEVLSVETEVTYRKPPVDTLDSLKREYMEAKVRYATEKYLLDHKREITLGIKSELLKDIR